VNRLSSSVVHNPDSTWVYPKHRQPYTLSAFHRTHIDLRRQLEILVLHLLSQCIPRVNQIGSKQGLHPKNPGRSSQTNLCHFGL